LEWFLRLWTSLSRFLWYFLSVLFQKWAGKWVLGKKTFNPDFLTTTMTRIYAKLDEILFDLFF